MFKHILLLLFYFRSICGKRRNSFCPALSTHFEEFTVIYAHEISFTSFNDRTLNYDIVPKTSDIKEDSPSLIQQLSHYLTIISISCAV